MVKEDMRQRMKDLGLYQRGRQAPGERDLRVQASVAHLGGHPKDSPL